jgi:hypothetical protein
VREWDAPPPFVPTYPAAAAAPAKALTQTQCCIPCQPSISQIESNQPVVVQSQNIPRCEPALEITEEEMRLQMNLFSRTFDKVFFANAWEIY